VSSSLLEKILPVTVDTMHAHEEGWHIGQVDCPANWLLITYEGPSSLFPWFQGEDLNSIKIPPKHR